MRLHSSVRKGDGNLVAAFVISKLPGVQTTQTLMQITNKNECSYCGFLCYDSMLLSAREALTLGKKLLCL